MKVPNLALDCKINSRLGDTSVGGGNGVYFGMWFRSGTLPG
jgi:hypothetical protein